MAVAEMSHYLRDLLWMNRAQLKASHYEVSPREREDEDRRLERDFGTAEDAAFDEDDRIRRMGEGGKPEDAE